MNNIFNYQISTADLQEFWTYLTPFLMTAITITFTSIISFYVMHKIRYIKVRASYINKMSAQELIDNRKNLSPIVSFHRKWVLDFYAIRDFMFVEVDGETCLLFNYTGVFYIMKTEDWKHAPRRFRKMYIMAPKDFMASAAEKHAALHGKKVETQKSVEVKPTPKAKIKK